MKMLNQGSKDNFQNVMDEIDKIDANAFTFNSMGNTISDIAII